MSRPARKLAEPEGLHVVMPWAGCVISLELDEAEAAELAAGRVPQRIQDDARACLKWLVDEPDVIWHEAKR